MSSEPQQVNVPSGSTSAASDGCVDRPALRVLVDQDLCTGDGLCAQYAPEVFELDIDGLAYVKDSSGELRTAPGAQADVPDSLVGEVIDSARECPGECIHVVRAHDGVAVAGPDTP